MMQFPVSGVWGYPWHGLCTGGVISGSAGKTRTQPPHGDAWLIDMGLPAISLTASETTEAAALGYEWRNTALISAGTVYETALPGESFIHVDSASQCWLVTLSYTYPATNTLRISASIKRFGLFGFGASTPVTKTVDIACADIELGISPTDDTNYTSRRARIEDVWTNGARVLVGVLMVSPRGGGGTNTHLCSLVELTISGSGGADGSGLSFSASEEKEHADLTPVTIYQSSGNWEYLSTGVSRADPCGAGASEITVYLLEGWGADVIFARFGYYNIDGDVCAARLRIYYAIINSDISASSGVIDSASGIYGDCYLISVDREYTQTSISGIYLLENDTELDKLEFQRVSEVSKHEEMHSWCTNIYACSTLAVGAPTESVTTTNTWSGSLASYFTSADSFDVATDASEIVNAFRAENDHQATGLASAYLTSATVADVFGYQRIDAKSHALFKNGTTRDYDQVITQTGVISGPSAASGNIYAAWQRKTGDFSFSTSPICYV